MYFNVYVSKFYIQNLCRFKYFLKWKRKNSRNKDGKLMGHEEKD